ncbi:MAG: DNA-processing protein DprA, partial [Planctomycetota bacterium]
MSQSNLRAYLKLHLAEGVGARVFRRLIEHFGRVEAAAAAGERELRAVQGVGEKLAGAIAGVTGEQIEREIDAAGKKGVVILTQRDPAYPKALRSIYDCPPVLYVLGRLEPADALAVAVVGARRCSHYGIEQAERFGELLGGAGFTVVSGGARGIDTAAHRGALAAGGRTIAVMGCGLADVYPRENEKLFERIVSERRGAIVSELPMLADVRAGNFHSRNR